MRPSPPPADRSSPRALDRALRAWYVRARRTLPWRANRDPYRVLVSEIMLQQTTVRAVVPYYRRFLRRFPTLRSLARAPEASVLTAWSGLGYYRRARLLRRAARTIAARPGGRFPRRFEEILALPGVGRYTAGAIASIAFGERRPILDGNVARVLSRLFLVRGPGKAPARVRRLWDLAGRLVEVTPDPGSLNQAIMELGATVCLPADPDCAACPVEPQCAARAAGVERRVPAPAPRRPTVARRASLLLVERDGRYLMRRRAGTGLMDGLWEFPTTGIDAGDGATGALRIRPGGILGVVRHAITYRRYQVTVRRAHVLAEPRGLRHRWVDPDRIRSLPVSSLVAKVLVICRNRGLGTGRHAATIPKV